MERRARRRFPLHLPMTVRWKTKSGISQTQTESWDVSSEGIYFFMPKHIEDDSPVEMVMTMPAEDALEGRTRLRCHGRVQRTEILELDRVGVAVRIESYQFLHENEDERSLVVVKT